MTFVLKGSTVQRQASEKEKCKELPTLKDNDFLDDKYKLNLPADARQKLIDMLTADTSVSIRLCHIYKMILVSIASTFDGLFIVSWNS